jgi:hypothetical protein
LHVFFDPEKKGYTSMHQCIFTLLNYYKIVMLPSDLKTVLNDYIIKEDKLNTTDDLLDSSFREESVTKVDYLEFLQEVARPYVNEVAQKELFISYQNFMKLTYNCLSDLLNTCKDSLMDLFLKDVNEVEINSFDKFSSFVCSFLGDELKIPNNDC